MKGDRFSDLIPELRRKKKFTIKELAEEVGINESYLGKIEKDTRIPSPALIIRLSQVLEYPRSTLLRLARNIKILKYIERMRQEYIFSNH